VFQPGRSGDPGTRQVGKALAPAVPSSGDFEFARRLDPAGSGVAVVNAPGIHGGALGQ
jgi:hypothetical protein